MIYRALTRLPNYFRAFGIVGGLTNWLRIELRIAHNSNQIIKVVAKGYSESISIRNSRSDRSTFWQNMVRMQYRLDSFPQYAQLQQHYRQSLDSNQIPIIVDGGANIGLSTLFLNRLFPEAHIFAIEPDLENNSILEENTKHIRDKVTVLTGALWPERSKLCISNPDGGSASFRMIAAPPTATSIVESFTLNDLLKDSNADEFLMVKLDIEGSQIDLFTKNTEWVNKTCLITLELDDWQFPWSGSSCSFFTCLSRYRVDYLLQEESIFCFLHECCNNSSHSD